jgi:hypothetical protein
MTPPQPTSVLGLLETAIEQLTPTSLPDLSAWEGLISFRPPHEVQRATVRTGPDWTIQRIEKAYGDINLDYYSVSIARLPAGFSAPEALLSHIRVKLADFLDKEACEFTPYDEQVNGPKWRGPDPLSAVMHFNMTSLPLEVPANFEDGSVICSEIDANHWIFSTLWTPDDLDHPVSGNRLFGVSRTDQGWEVFTRGADRISTWGNWTSNWVISDLVFRGGHRCWTSFQRRVREFVQSHDGGAALGVTSSHRYRWSDVEAAYYHPTVTWL